MAAATKATAKSTATASSPSAEGIANLLASKEMIIVCGSGGVGKTTTAAALAAEAAIHIGGRGTVGVVAAHGSGGR